MVASGLKTTGTFEIDCGSDGEDERWADGCWLNAATTEDAEEECCGME